MKNILIPAICAGMIVVLGIAPAASAKQACDKEIGNKCYVIKGKAGCGKMKKEVGIGGKSYCEVDLVRKGVDTHTSETAHAAKQKCDKKLGGICYTKKGPKGCGDMDEVDIGGETYCKVGPIIKGSVDGRGNIIPPQILNH